MAVERCVVTSVHADWVGIQPMAGGSGCGGCAQRKGCGQGLWAQLLGSGARRELRARWDRTQVGAVAVGDTVEVVLGDSALLQAALVAYGLPMAGLMLGLGIGDASGFAAVGAVAGLVLGGALGRYWVGGQASERYEPEITAVIAAAVAHQQGAFAP